MILFATELTYLHKTPQISFQFYGLIVCEWPMLWYLRYRDDESHQGPTI